MSKFLKILGVIVAFIDGIFFLTYVLGYMLASKLLILICIFLFVLFVALMLYFTGELLEVVSIANYRLEKIIKPFKKFIE